MDRLQTLTPRRARAAAACAPLALALFLAACDEGDDEKSAAPSGRVVAVASKDEASTSELCDVLAPAGSAPNFAYPPLDGDAPAAGPGWRWINVWASWCAPCVEEMPLLVKMREQLTREGLALDLVLVSVDSEAEAMTTFQKAHPEARGSVRLRDMSELQTWLTGAGLDDGATLPVHLFVDPQGKVRCARTGAIKASDAAHIKKLML